MAALEETLEVILRRHPVWRGGPLSSAPPATPTGFDALDRELPGGGWPAGALTELLGRREGIGELQLVLPALAALSWAGKRIVWLAPPHLPYAPALAAAGVDLAQLVVVRAPGRRDALVGGGAGAARGQLPCAARLVSERALRGAAAPCGGRRSEPRLGRPVPAAAKRRKRFARLRCASRWSPQASAFGPHPQAPRRAGRRAARACR